MSIEFRQWNQARRIQHGIDNGSLSAREVGVLRGQQGTIQGAVANARADGTIDAKERAQIKMLQDAASHDIYSLKHNGERNDPGRCGTPPGPNDTTRMDRRQGRQSDRIEAGLAKGQLTQEEAQKLVGQQQQIHQFEQFALSDGTISPQERARMEQLQDQASMAIFLARHNSISGR